MKMKCGEIEIVMQEVPGEISICFPVTGCNVQCKGCHSAWMWNRSNGTELTHELYISTLTRYHGLASTVLFMGGEWYKEQLVEFLCLAHAMGYNTCLYTGRDEVDEDILNNLTWVKTGRWIEECGGLDNPFSNQKFIYTKTRQTLNHLFVKA